MKKLLLPLAALFAIAACNKDDDSDEVTNYGTFKVGTTTYVATKFTKTAATKTVVVSDDQNHALNFVFFTLPTAGGTYRIVNAPDEADEVAMTAVIADDSTSTYFTGDEGATRLTVTMTDGKATMTLPATYFFGYNVNDSLNVEANAIER